MNKNVYKGLRRRKTYDEQLDYLFNHQEIIKYPKRVIVPILDDYEAVKQAAKEKVMQLLNKRTETEPYMIDSSIYADVGEFKKDYEEKLYIGEYVIDYTTATSNTSENPKQPPIDIPMNKNDKSVQVKPNSEKSTISQTAKIKGIQKAYEKKDYKR
jgi:hypothetical protein